MKKRKQSEAVDHTQPKPEPISVEPIHRMVEDLQAIAQLAERRSRGSLEAAQALLRRTSFNNECLYILMRLEQELQATPVLDRPMP